MAINSVLQTIRNAEIDARSLSEFIYSPADAMVSRRLAPSIHTLQYYVDRFETIDSSFTQALNTANAAAVTATNNAVGLIDDVTNNAYQQVSSAIDGVAIDANLVTDALVTTSIRNPNQVVRTQASKNAESVSVKDFGATGNGIVDDTSAIQKTIDALHNSGGGVATMPTGTYFITEPIVMKSNVHLKGDGSGSTIIEQKDGGFTAIITEEKEFKPLVLSNNLKIGDDHNNIVNTCQSDDMIVYRSDLLFTRRWTDSVVRAQYKEGEMLEVKSATNNRVDFKQKTIIDCNLTDNPIVEYFTPSKNITITGLTVKRESTTATSGPDRPAGIKISQTVGTYIDDVQTLNYDTSGIEIAFSSRAYINKTHHVSGEYSGLNYGTVYTNGSRQCYQNSVSGDYCRHVVAAGGSLAVPCYNVVNNIIGNNSQNGVVDCHALSAYFTYSNITADNLGGMSGLGHKLINAVATGSDTSLSHGIVIYEGGKDITYSNIQLTNHGRIYTNQSVLNSTFKDITMIADKFNYFYSAKASSDCNFINVRLVCPKASNAKSNAEALSCFDADYGIFGLGNFCQRNLYVDRLYVEGFPIAAYTAGSNTTFNNVTAVNCGWKVEGKEQTGVISIGYGSSNTFNEFTIKNTNEDLEYHYSISYVATRQGSAYFSKNVVFSNINDALSSDSCKPVNSVRIEGIAGYIQDMHVSNVKLKYSGSKAGIVAGLKDEFFSNQNIIANEDMPNFRLNAGRTEQRPTHVPTGFVYYDTTLGKPVFWSANRWVDANGVES